jgi:hypothetical protein
MSGLFLLSESQMARIAPHFPLASGEGPKPDRIMINATHLKAHRQTL